MELDFVSELDTSGSFTGFGFGVDIEVEMLLDSRGFSSFFGLLFSCPFNDLNDESVDFSSFFGLFESMLDVDLDKWTSSLLGVFDFEFGPSRFSSEL